MCSGLERSPQLRAFAEYICSLLHTFHSRDCQFKLLCRSESVLTQPTALVAQVCVTPESCWNGELDHSGGTEEDEMKAWGEAKITNQRSSKENVSP